jgi:glycosyltransferase involved in cell wall biosynthesis
VTVTVGWEGSAADAPHFAAIQPEILRAALSDPNITVHTIGYAADARDPLWQLGERWRIDGHGAENDFHIRLVPLIRPPAYGGRISRAAVASMRAGVPVIGTERWPLRALIVDGVTGVLIPEKKPRDWNRAILRLAADARLRQAMGDAAARAAGQFSDGRGSV